MSAGLGRVPCDARSPHSAGWLLGVREDPVLCGTCVLRAASRTFQSYTLGVGCWLLLRQGPLCAALGQQRLVWVEKQLCPRGKRQGYGQPLHTDAHVRAGVHRPVEE